MTPGTSQVPMLHPAGEPPVDRLLLRLSESGIRVWVEKGQLRYRARAGAFSPELKDEVLRLRASLIARLEAETPEGSPHRKPAAGPEIPRLARGTAAPLSFMQRRLWLLEETGAGSAYNVPLAFRIHGPLDLGALEAASRDLLARHDVLRSRLTFRDGDPRQVTVDASSFTIQRIDRPGASPAELADAAEELATRPFTLSQDLLFRVIWISRAPDEGLLLFSMHHWVTDLWSNPILFRELAALYGKHAGNAGADAITLDELPIQYSDFAAWQESWLKGPEAGAQLAYWKTRLADPPVLELPLDRNRPPQFSFAGGRSSLDVDAETARRLEAFRKEEGCTPFLVMLAAWCVLLHKYSNSHDIITAAPVSNRSLPGLEGLIGFFVNTVPLRQRIDPGESFRGFLKRAAEETLQDLENAQAPLDAILEHVHVERSADRNPLFQHVLVVNPPAEGGLRLPGLSVEAIPLLCRSSKFDLTLFVQPDANGMRLHCEYAADLFDPESASLLLRRFRALLEMVLAQPDLPIKDLSLLLPGDRDRLRLWNNTAKPYPRDQTIHARFAEMAARYPTRPAVLWNGGSWSYQDLDSASASLAAQVAAHNLPSGAPVAVYLERSPWLIAALLGILRAGCAYCPVDLRYPAARVTTVFDLARCAVLVTEVALRQRLPGFQGPVVEINPSASPANAPADPGALTLHAISDRGPTKAEDPAYINFTSGSTGLPKGVLVPHRAVLRLVFGIPGVELDSSTRILHASSIGFDASTFEIWGPLLHGGACCLHPEAIPTTGELQDAIERHHVDTVFFTTGLFNAILDEDPRAIAGLRRILTGGEVMSQRHLREALLHLPNVDLFNVYGPTENTTFTTCYPIPRTIAGDVASVPIGRPLANTRLAIVDPYLHLVAPGIPGELLVSGDGLALGYIHDETRTAESFVTLQLDPGGPPERWYRTGDLARFLSNGDVEFAGRLDEQVKIRGFRVEPGEIETVLRAFPGVGSAVVLTERDESESLRLLAYYTQLAESPFEETALRNFLDSKLPDYMRPSCLLRVDALPLNASGKVDRKALPKPPSAGHSSAADRCKPSNLWELQLCEIFRDVLGCGPVDPTDDFFRLGGTSLAAVKVFARAESVFRHRLPLAALFRSPTVRELASEFRQSKKGSWSVLVPIQPQGTLPPVFWLHTLGGGGGGGLLRYREAALRLEDDRPSFGIEAPEKPFENFGSMASHYADVILDFRPRGPYCLAGFCFGGNVAYAVACELEKRGILVDALFLLESAPPQKSRGRLLRYAFTPTGMAVLARRALLYSRMPLSTHRNLPRKLLARLRRSRNGRRNVPTIPQEEANGIPVDQLDAPVRLSEYPPHLQRYVQTHWAALLRYSPRRYSGSAVVFRVEKPLGYPAMRPDFGWSDWIAGEIAIEKIHGDHHHFLEPPAVNHLAERMRARLAGIA